MKNNSTCSGFYTKRKTIVSTQAFILRQMMAQGARLLGSVVPATFQRVARRIPAALV